MDIETRLRQDLADRAHRISAAPDDLLEQVLDGHRAQRRHRAGLGALTALVVAVAVLVPLTVTGGGEGRTAAPNPTPSSMLPPAPVAGGPLIPYQRYDLAPRGSLAEDPAYLQGLLDRPWSADASTDPAPESRQVVFAGEVPGGVQALVVGEQDGGLVGLWLHGPAGAAPGDLQAAGGPGPIDLSRPLTSSYTQDGVGALVVVGRPGDVIEVSPGLDIAADGSVRPQPYGVVGDTSGVAVVDAAELSLRTLAVQVTRNGQVIDVYAQGATAEGTPLVPDLTAAFAGASGSPDDGLVRSLAQQLPDDLGVPAVDLDVHVLWGGQLGTSGLPDAEGVLLTAQVPSGAVVVLGGYGADRAGAPDGRAFTAVVPCTQAVLPAGTDVAGTGVAMSCDLTSTEDGSDLGQQLVVLPPPGTADLQVTGDGGAVLESYDVREPAVVAPAPNGAVAVTALDAAGQPVQELPLRGVDQLQTD